VPRVGGWPVRLVGGPCDGLTVTLSRLTSTVQIGSALYDDNGGHLGGYVFCNPHPDEEQP
jgi:hypothetical protein